MPTFRWERDLVVPPGAARAWWFDYRVVRKDLEAHAQEMEDAWKTKPW